MYFYPKDNRIYILAAVLIISAVLFYCCINPIPSEIIYDKIIFLNYNRFFCLKSVIKRYKENIGKTRSDMAIGCDEKLDFEFILIFDFQNQV